MAILASLARGRQAQLVLQPPGINTDRERRAARGGDVARRIIESQAAAIGGALRGCGALHMPTFGASYGKRRSKIAAESLGVSDGEGRVSIREILQLYRSTDDNGALPARIFRAGNLL